jgi:hypothetical protein
MTHTPTTRGRKPLPKGEAKIQVTMYIPEKIINYYGMTEAKKMAEQYILTQYGTSNS